MEAITPQSSTVTVPVETESKLPLQVTPAALAQIAKLSGKRKAEGKAATGLRIGLRGGGCDGFSYVFEWAEGAPKPHDHVFNFDWPTEIAGGQPGEKLQVVIDKKSMLYLAGTTLNFVSGLMGHGFKFENPNVKGACGCGDSVQF